MNRSLQMGKGTDAWLPDAGNVVLVQCEKYQCLAYRDLAGSWRSYYKHDQLPPVLRIVQPLQIKRTVSLAAKT